MNNRDGQAGCVIRACVADDLAEVARLHAQSFDDAWPVEAFLSLMARPGVAMLVAERVGTLSVEGFILTSVASDEAEVLTFCVAPGARRSGTGAALLAAAVSQVAGMGARQVFLEVNQANGDALRLYERAGFQLAGRRAGYYRQGATRSDALVLKLMINGGNLPPAGVMN